LQQLPLGPGKNVAFAGRSAMKTQKMTMQITVIKMMLPYVFITDVSYTSRR
jgi:hypothetical protein